MRGGRAVNGDRSGQERDADAGELLEALVEGHDFVSARVSEGRKIGVVPEFGGRTAGRESVGAKRLPGRRALAQKSRENRPESCRTIPTPRWSQRHHPGRLLGYWPASKSLVE